MEWFGDYWPSALTWGGEHASPPPFETECRFCGEVFELGAQGVWIPDPRQEETFVSMRVEGLDAHLARERRMREARFPVHRGCFELAALSRGRMLLAVP